MLSLRPLRSHAPRQRSAYARPPYSPHFASFRFNSTRTAHPQSNGPVTQSEVPKVKLAIVGGGLGGLSSAFYFLRNLSPRLREGVEVVIFEKDHKRTGGWCRSVRVDSEGKETGTKSVEAGGATGEEKEVVFETGPRSIRPVGLSGWLTVEMANAIGLNPTTATSQLITIPKSSPSAKNRYVFYPDKLTVLPSSLFGALHALMFTPLLRSTLPGILSEPFRRRNKAHLAIEHSSAATTTTTTATRPEAEDESVDSFFSRRFGKPLAENMISAMIHGIYSGDTRRLSMRSLFPQLWEVERESRSLILGLLFSGLKRKMGLLPESPFRLEARRNDEEMEIIKEGLRECEEGRELVERMERASVWGVKGGLEKLTDRLRDWCVEQGVQIRMGDQGAIDQIVWEGAKGWKIVTPAGAYHPTHLITTLPNLLPSSLLPPPIPSATVSVVNLAFPSTPSAPLFPPGFGYLIPRSVKEELNPHHILGIIFDSDVMPGVDGTKSEKEIKITLILGGSYWLSKGVPSPLLSEEQLKQAALSTLALHFPDTVFPPPLHVLTSTHLDCIPQPPVGHTRNMKEFRIRLEGLGAKGNVGIVGGGTGAVGVNGAVKDAWEVGTSFARSLEDGGRVLTGLESWK